jgi:hypothetical protein
MCKAEMTGVCIPLEFGDLKEGEEWTREKFGNCPWGFKIAKCKVCDIELNAHGYFCPEHVPIYIIPENKGYKA